MLHVKQLLQVENFQAVQTGAARLMLSGLKDPARAGHAEARAGHAEARAGHAEVRAGHAEARAGHEEARVGHAHHC